MIGGCVRSGLREEIAAEKGARRRLEEESAFPRVGQVRGVEPGEAPLAGRERLAIGECARRAVRGIGERDRGADEARHRRRARRRRQELVHRSALVRFDVRKTDPSELVDRQDARDRLAHRPEQTSPAGVEEERLVVHDQDLVEREAARHLPDRGADAVNAIANLTDDSH